MVFLNFLWGLVVDNSLPAMEPWGILLFSLVMGMIIMATEVVVCAVAPNIRHQARNRAYFKPKMAPQPPPQYDITPRPNASLVATLTSYRREIELQAARVEQKTPCGIIWAVSSINGSKTDYAQLSTVGKGEGRFRLLAVLYEAISSAAATKYLLRREKMVPSNCVIAGSTNKRSKIELTIYIDRDIVTNLREHDVLADLQCAFDKIVYFDELPQLENHVTISPYKRLHMLVRLAPRPNLMKLIAFLSTPYEYTLYLDGDTQPCPGFQKTVFSRIAHHDILTSPNPFGYVSTDGKKVYAGSPGAPPFASFPEINGGVFAFHWTNRTEQLILRTIELFPYFAAELGFDQDQAMMRHALFESKFHHGIDVFTGEMSQYCRYGWQCEQNSCAAGCEIIHQRNCLESRYNSSDVSTCAGKMTLAFHLSKHYHIKNFNLNAKNRLTGRSKVLSATEQM
jgi:hypothetical protein